MRQTHLVILIVTCLLLCSCRKASSRSKRYNKTEDVEIVEDNSYEDDYNEVPEIDSNSQDDDSYSEDEEVPEIDAELYESDMLPRLTVSKPNQILRREGYVTSYNNNTKNANWVAWHLTAEHTTGSWSRDGIPYMVDYEVKGSRQELDDWYNNNLPIDHGHMCPAGDNKWSKDAMEQTFLLTNMCPQNSDLNRGDWEELESRCRGWARHYGDIYIVCGPIFYNSNYKTIGSNKVGVPDAFYKVVLCLSSKTPQALGFIYPNEGTHHKMSYYSLTVDEVEEKTGIDFFSDLPDDIESKVESVSNLSRW